MTKSDSMAALSKSLDEAIEGLTAFDAEGLETLEQRLRAVTAEYRAHGLAVDRETLPLLLQKHTLLQAMLKATAANLQVVESVFDVRRTRVNDRRENTHGYLDRTAEYVAQRADRRPVGAKRNGQ